MPFALANIDGRAALVDADSYYDLESISSGSFSSDPMAAIAAHRELGELAASLGSHSPTGSMPGAQLGPPVPSPISSFGVGLNYADHIAESGVEAPAAPVIFTKYPPCIVGPHDDVVLNCDTADYEAELVAVVGTGGRNIAAGDAWGHVAGLTCGQDISDRGLQFAASPPHFGLGKSRDTYGPIGPLLVSPDSFADSDNLGLTCTVNGEERQHSSTANLIFDVPYLIEYLSAIMTLSPGDVIFTGTPSGVGLASGAFLVDGDVIVTEIEGIGTMTNLCVGSAT